MLFPLEKSKVRHWKNKWALRLLEAPVCLSAFSWEAYQNILEETALDYLAGSHFSSPASCDDMGAQSLCARCWDGAPSLCRSACASSLLLTILHLGITSPIFFS